MADRVFADWPIGSSSAASARLATRHRNDNGFEEETLG